MGGGCGGRAAGRGSHDQRGGCCCCRVCQRARRVSACVAVAGRACCIDMCRLAGAASRTSAILPTSSSASLRKSP